MIIDANDLIKEVDKSFWKYLTKEVPLHDVIHYKDIDKNEFLKRVANDVNEYKVSFSKPDYYYMSKDNGILRKIKVFSLEDSVIYYYCVKKIQSKLVEKIKENKNSFGGFLLTPIRNSNKQVETSIDYDVIYGNGFNKKNYRSEWSEYQKLAKDSYKKNYGYYMHIDINHFYDDINLDILEKNLRNVVQDKVDLINLLFHFLKYSDKQDLGYFPSNVGIPQEIVAEMSRILANFYLSDFDKIINEHLSSYFGAFNYHYFRYSDDMWLCFDGDSYDAIKLRQWISLELQKIKLHINERKIEQFSASEFCAYWRFDDWDEIDVYKTDIDFLINKFNYIVNDKNGRWFSVASYILKIITSNLKNTIKFDTATKVESLIEVIISIPSIAEKLEDKHILFLKRVVKNYPSIKSQLISYIYSKKNIYPTTEYLVLQILSKIQNDTDILKFFISYYQQLSNKDGYQWYSRCICLDYFIKNTTLISRERCSARILNVLSISNCNKSVKERRYELYLLAKFSNSPSHDIIQKNYSSPEDFLFLKYLRYI